MEKEVSWWWCVGPGVVVRDRGLKVFSCRGRSDLHGGGRWLVERRTESAVENSLFRETDRGRRRRKTVMVIAAVSEV
ncbi:hypothetical protein L2E82_31255 [Cichorium intybus]|uniref:Uncharacterized protein n=1 Tax=Cichorium intybus TaxID=13427 RepID=A0ACB9D2S9_CICIN|nr:hypothetical protein L2E82_31255 [Cichorium intybus]